MDNKKRVLVVGAGGFTGGFIVAEGLKRGYEVWAGVRQSTSREYLSDERIRFIVFDFEDQMQIIRTLENTLPGEKWDYIIYNLGATKVIRYSDFNHINYEYLKEFTGALHQSGKVPERFLYISSLSAVGAYDERGYGAVSEEIIPQPNTRYGASKLKAELWLATARIPYIILRPTGIYGPHDKDYFLMLDSIRKGVDFGVGYRRQMLTFIYVEDLARAVYDALERGKEGEIYNITESRGYTQKEFRGIAMTMLGKRFVMPVRVPIWAVRAVCAVAEKIGVVSGKPSTLNRDKFRILKQRNWNCSGAKAERDFGFKAQVDLKEGLRRAIEWYKSSGWLK